jgi:hypothetical protein
MTFDLPELINAQWFYVFTPDNAPIVETKDDPWTAKPSFSVRVTNVTISVCDGNVKADVEGRRLRKDGSPDARYGFSVRVWNKDVEEAFINSWAATDGRKAALS